MSALGSHLSPRRLFSTLRGRYYFVVLHILIGALTLEVILLATENRQLKARSATLPLKQIERGDHFVLTELENLGKAPWAESSSYRALFVFTTGCPFCIQSLQSWRVITLIAQSLPMNVQGISLDRKRTHCDLLETPWLSFPWQRCQTTRNSGKRIASSPFRKH